MKNSAAATVRMTRDWARSMAMAAMVLANAGVAQGAVTTFLDEASYLAAVGAGGYVASSEGFEDGATWETSRSPGSVTDVTSLGILWDSNFAANDLSTSGGAARTGGWGAFSSPHGDPTRLTDTATCDVDAPPPGCLMHDGLMGTSVGAGTLFGVGVWISGTAGGQIIMLLDNNQVGFGGVLLAGGGHQFFGVVDPAGFSTFEIRETEGKTGNEKFIFADDFRIAVVPESNSLALLSLGLVAIGLRKLRTRPAGLRS